LLQISFIENLSKDESAALLQEISFRISLSQENLPALEAFRGANSILIGDLDKLA
jgi:hypothetical protein